MMTHRQPSNSRDDRSTDELFLSNLLDKAIWLSKTVKGPFTFPGWTEFNLTVKRIIPNKVDNIGYLPIIIASPTE